MDTDYRNNFCVIEVNLANKDLLDGQPIVDTLNWELV